MQAIKNKDSQIEVMLRKELVNDLYYLAGDSYQYKTLLSAITNEEQIYRFTDCGIQAKTGYLLHKKRIWELGITEFRL